MERRLAAVLAADVVGYSRLMGQDEPGTLASLRGHRAELIEPSITKHHGRIVKLMGDGLLAEYGSVVEAVECAVEIQHDMAERNIAMPANRRMILRIGVHLGNVMVDDGDLHGDGVNIAARLESIAEAGGVCLSRQAFDQVEGKLGFRFQHLDPRQLENIANPVDVHAIGSDEDASWSRRAPAPAMDQEIHDCRTPDGLRLAWAKVGFVALPGNNHILQQDEPAADRFFEEVSTFLGA